MNLIEPSLWQTAVELQRYLDSIDHRVCFIGGIVVQRWGQPRVTGDVDATILVTFGMELRIATEVLKRYQSRIDDPLPFAIQARILLLKDLAGNKIDLSLGGMPYEERMLERATEWSIPGHGRIRTCCAEDLIVLKAFADRPQDWIDVENIIIRQTDRLDRQLILDELTMLAELKEEPEILDQLNHLFDQHPAK